VLVVEGIQNHGVEKSAAGVDRFEGWRATNGAPFSRRAKEQTKVPLRDQLTLGGAVVVPVAAPCPILLFRYTQPVGPRFNPVSLSYL
jgi:hypothetical protein